MIHTPHIRTFDQHEWAVYKDLRLRALADSPDAFGSTLAREQNRSDAEWASRLAEGANSWDFPGVAEVAGEPTGLAWGRIKIQSRCCKPVSNVGCSKPPVSRSWRMLLEAVIAWARAKNASYLELGVTCGDSPATFSITRSLRAGRTARSLPAWIGVDGPDDAPPIVNTLWTDNRARQ